MSSILIGVGVLYAFMLFSSLIVAAVYSILKKRTRKGAKIAVISVSGPLSYSKESGSNFQKFLKRVKEVSEMGAKALILEVNSPGGTVMASQEMYFALQKLREKGVKIVSLMESVAASGGVYIAMAADKIVAHPSTITGSIGVIIRGYDISGLLDRLSIREQVVKSGKFKDIMSQSRRMTDEEKELLQDTMIRPSYDEFCSVVAESRKLTVAQVHAFADGRIMPGTEAKRVGLVDEVGNYETALKIAKEFAGIDDKNENVKVVNLSKSSIERITSRVRVFSLFSEVFFCLKFRGEPLWFLKRF